MIGFLLIFNLLICGYIVLLQNGKTNVVKLATFIPMLFLAIYILVSGCFFAFDCFDFNYVLCSCTVVELIVSVYFKIGKKRTMREVELSAKNYIVPLTLALIAFLMSIDSFGYFGMEQDQGVYQVKAIDLLYGSTNREYVFPEYDLSELEFECDNETGIITEFYRFSVKETISGIRANIAEIDLAYSGEITFAVGSHNSKDKIEEIVDADGDLYDNSDAVKDAVFDFINSNKEEIKKNYEAEDEEMESEIVLSEEDALPDGFKPGDTITKTHLPEYEMVLSNREDIHNFHAEKIILNDRLFWECTGDIYTNWGEYDSSLNASFYLTIDNTTGEIENVSFTDSDLE